MNKKVFAIIIFMVILVSLAGGVILISKTAKRGGNTNSHIKNINLSSNENSALNNQNTNSEETETNSAVANEEVTVEGMVFIKGYKTPSESYGIATTDGHEIGLGKYDTMKEQLRPYIGEKISVTFESVCKSSNENCCRTLFTYCGSVKNWNPVAVNTNGG